MTRSFRTGYTPQENGLEICRECDNGAVDEKRGHVSEDEKQTVGYVPDV